MDSPTEQVPAAAIDPLVGATLDGRYRIDGLIGRGGMAAVYRADDLALGRRVAVKVFTSSTEGIDDADRRRSETALLASLTHPALVTLFDAAKDPETNREFLVMELVEGSDLREILRRGPISSSDATRMLADLSEGLHVIHSRGIVHRDVKPANVLLAPAHLPTRRWNAKLADFGIARLLDESRLTATGRIIGTPGYLSPEQVRGEPIGSSADLYSLGLLMLEALTGEQPFPGPALESASARRPRPRRPGGARPGLGGPAHRDDRARSGRPADRARRGARHPDARRLREDDRGRRLRLAVRPGRRRGVDPAHAAARVGGRHPHHHRRDDDTGRYESGTRGRRHRGARGAGCVGRRR